MEVQIFADGLRVVTTKQAASTRGITLAGMRAVLGQNGVRPLTYLDGRTPLYDAAALERLPASGRGTHRRGRAA